jgi:hypothetical protein
MSQKEDERRKDDAAAEEDLELTESQADQVKGGFLPIEGGGSPVRGLTKTKHKGQAKHHKKKH